MLTDLCAFRLAGVEIGVLLQLSVDNAWVISMPTCKTKPVT